MNTARAASTGTPRYSETMPCEPQSARRARRLIHTVLSVWDVRELADTATLVVSELVGNSVQHTPCALLRVTISRPVPHRVKIAVTDKSSTAPDMADPVAEAERGRGLFLVDMLSDRWGYDRHRWGKTVWAELEVPAY
ncbi:ATP-binding protein [Streptomyces smaragdinus]|nr:ATP-binding protein [Streptomyces smaragdinus]